MRAHVDKDKKVETLYEGKFLRLVRNGEWEYIQRNNCTAIVIIAALTREHECIFVEQYRPPVNRRVIEFPAGLVNDQGLKTVETNLTAAKRELLEETGYVAKGWKKALEGPAAGGSCADLVNLYLAFNAQKKGEGGGDEFEDIKVHIIPLSEADKWLAKKQRNGLLVEPKIYTGLYHLKTYNKVS